MEELHILKWFLIATIVLNFLYYATVNGTLSQLFFYGTIMFWVLFLYTFLGYLYRTAEIRKLQKNIRDNIPSQWTARDTGEGFQRPSKVRLGVFGVQDSGKSSFLNSLHFAFEGNWKEVYVEKGNELDGGETLFRDAVKLSDNVTTIDTRGLVDLSVSRVPEVIAQITGQRGIDTRSHAPGEKIDCPIFILRYSGYTGTEDCIEFLGPLVAEVRKHLCGYPIMVVTFADRISHQENVLGQITRAGMAKGSVFFIENYTYENHEMDSKKHIDLLKILEACIKRAHDNISLLSNVNSNGPHY